MPGKFYEDFAVGMQMRHAHGRTISEGEHMLFCAITMNQQPLHIDAHFASQSVHGQRLVNGLFTLSLVVGISVSDTTDGTLVANLGYETVRHPHPVFHGDTIYAETDVVAMRDSGSRPDCGIVTLNHRGLNQHDSVVVEATRTALIRRRPS